VRSVNELLEDGIISGTFVPYMYTVRMPLAGKSLHENSGEKLCSSGIGYTVAIQLLFQQEELSIEDVEIYPIKALNLDLINKLL
jgi:hypothetical protein